MDYTASVGQFDKVIESAGIEGLCSPIENAEGTLHVLSHNGEVYSVVDSSLSLWFSTVGQPTSLTFDSAGSIYLCDMAHQAVLTQNEQDNRMEITPLIKEYNGKSFLGPNSILLNEAANCLYFTDSGPMGETSLENPRGSIYVADLDTMAVKPLAANCLAHPCGIARTSTGNSIFVAETMQNRIIRFTEHEGTGMQMSTFFQFSGRLGPTALAMSENNLLYVARYDFATCNQDGLISVINMNGELFNEFTVPNSPEISGLCFSKSTPNILYITENSTSTCYKMSVPTEQT